MTDLANEYQDHRTRLAQASAADELLSSVQAGKGGSTAAPATVPPAALTPEGQGSRVGRIAKDVGKGIVESPRGVVKGVRDAVQSTIDMGKELGDWVEQTGNVPVLYIDSNGVSLKTNQEVAGHRLADLANLPDLDAPKTVTGGMIKGVAQFLVGMKIAGATLRAVGVANQAGAVMTGIKGAIANFEAFDPHQARLSNLIQQFPLLQNPVTEYLASDADDSAAEGRFKNALEGTALGVLTDGLFKGIRLLKQIRAAKAAEKAAETAVATAPGTLADDAFRLLGDDSVPPGESIVRPQATEAPAAKATGSGLDLSPEEVAGMGTPTIPTQFAKAAKEIAVGEGRTADATGLWFLDGDKPVFTWNAGKDPKAVLGARAAELADYPSVTVGGVRAWFKPGQEATAEKVAELLESQPKSVAEGIERHREIGTLLGYPKAAVDRYAKAWGAKAQVLPDGNIGVPLEAAEPAKTYINFARIDTADDVKRAMQELADASKPGVDAARRGTQTFEQIKLNASERNAWKDLTARRVGEPMNAEQSLAARQLWVASTQKLTEVAEAAAQNPSEANLFAFRKMLATHDTIQTQVIAARTETARALASWRIPAGGSAERLRDVTAALQEAGGGDISRELAARVAKLGKAGMLKEMGAVAEKTAYARTRDAILEGWVNGLLSNPKTHVVNTTSNAAVLALRITERRVAESIARVLGDEESVAMGEASQQYAGLVDSIPDSFRNAAKSAVTGESGFGLGKLEAAREGAITSRAFNLSSESWLGRAIDMIGSIARIPGRALGAEDEFFKTAGYRMEVRAQAHRQVVQEVTAGNLTLKDAAKRMAELVENPPENIRMAAVDAAQYQTFTNAPGKLAQSLSRLTNEYPALKVILPFIKTPANILRFTFERTPLAPLMSQFRQNIAAGGARRDLALAQMGLGTTIMLSTADMAMRGAISGSGPVEKGTRDAMSREGWQPYSIQVGKRWYAYNRLDPLGSLLGMSADVVDAMKNMQHEAVDDADTEKLAVAMSLAIGGNLVNKTYLSGLSNLFEALSDPQQYGEAKIQNLVGSVVPGAVAATTRIQDPYQRQVYSMLDALKARVPGLSSTLPPRRNLWGEPVSYESGFGVAFDAFSPVASKKPSDEPIDKELLRLESNLTPPGRKTSFNGVTVDLSQNPKIYSRYLELAGNELKHPAWGLGAKDLLNAIVSGNHPLSAVYQIRSDGPDGGKDTYIKDIVRQYRDLARDQLLREFPELAEQVGVKQERKRELRMPTIG